MEDVKFIPRKLLRKYSNDHETNLTEGFMMPVCNIGISAGYFGKFIFH